MNILIPILHFVPSGGYRVLSKLSDEFIKEGHSVDILAPVSSPLPYFPTQARIVWVGKGGECSTNKDSLKSFGKRKVQMYWHFYKAIKNYNKECRYNIVLANFFLTAYLIFFAKRKNAINFYYIQAYEADFFSCERGLSNKAMYLLAKASYRLPLKKIVNSEFYMRYKEIITNRLVYPGLDLSIFHNTNRRKFMEDGILRIGTIGRLEKHKGTRNVIEAYQTLRAERLPVQLIVAFGTKEMTNSDVEIITVQPHGDTNLADFYRSIDVYVAAVDVDGPAIHYPVIESMACHTTVITTPLYPADDSNAYIVRVQNVADIIEKVKIVLQESDKKSREQKLSKSANDIKKFEWHLVSTQMMNYFIE
jgi:glycosyltransferase involved in cell wall biosynthesis